MITLGELTLDSHLQVPDWFTATKVAGSERPTLGGGLVVQRLPSGPRQITLTAVQEGNRIYGKFTRAQLEAIGAMAQSGQVQDLNVHGRTARVVVPLGALSAVVPVRKLSDPGEDALYVGPIPLMEVR